MASSETSHSDDSSSEGEPQRVPEDIVTKIPLTERIKLRTGVYRAILNQAGYADAERYDGGSKDYRRWFMELTEQLSECGFKYISKDIKNPRADKLTDEQWNQLYSDADLRFIYDIGKSTVEQAASSSAANSKGNGVLFIRHFYSLWGEPSIANNYAALMEINNLKVAKHEDPSPAFKKLDYLFEDYFADAGENFKCSYVLKMLDRNKYKVLLDTLERDKGMTYERLKNDIKSYYNRSKTEHEAYLELMNSKNESKKAPRATGLGSVDQGNPVHKRKKFCKGCRRHVNDHTTANCPNSKGKGKAIELRKKEISKEKSKGLPAKVKQPSASSGASSSASEAAKLNDIAHVSCGLCGQKGHWVSICPSNSQYAAASIKKAQRSGKGRAIRTVSFAIPT